MNVKAHRNNLFIVFLGIGLTLIHCKNPKIELKTAPVPVLATHSNGENYVGSTQCVGCHPNIYQQHVKTGHFNTSSLANTNTIKGDLQKDTVLDLPSVSFAIKTQENGVYQHATIKNRAVNTITNKLDLVLGSGVRGQSFATWHKNELYQLQTSYYTPTNSWVNSPGFPNYYDTPRPVRNACLNCHATFAKTKATQHEYDKTSLILGIDCERCHGPAAKHVAYQNTNPEKLAAKFITSISNLPRNMRVELCAQCHSGKTKYAPFAYVPGYKVTQTANTSQVQQKPDVHGNQFGLLAQSKCYKNSAEMDCITCHNSHANERGNSKNFNTKCISCHKTSKLCTSKTSTQDCIRCHMPISPSKLVNIQLGTDSLATAFYFRTHRIGIYTN